MFNRICCFNDSLIRHIVEPIPTDGGRADARATGDNPQYCPGKQKTYITGKDRRLYVLHQFSFCLSPTLTQPMCLLVTGPHAYRGSSTARSSQQGRTAPPLPPRSPARERHRCPAQCPHTRPSQV